MTLPLVLDTEQYIDEREQPCMGPTLEVLSADAERVKVRVSWSRLASHGRSAEFSLARAEIETMLSLCAASPRPPTIEHPG